jgi:hypothetical protein
MNAFTRDLNPRAGWRALALALAALPPEQVPPAQAADFQRLRHTAWDVAAYDAFWRTVQLPSLGPGLLPWAVILLVTLLLAAEGRLQGAWPALDSPFVLWPSLWLLAWFGLTLAVAAVRHRRAQRQVLRLGVRLQLFSQSA